MFFDENFVKFFGKVFFVFDVYMFVQSILVCQVYDFDIWVVWVNLNFYNCLWVSY